MTTAEPNGRSRIVRVMTLGKAPEAVDRAILAAVEDGCRVLVRVPPDTAPPPWPGAASAAAWAGALSQAHGLAWERVGGDILFHRVSPTARREAP